MVDESWAAPELRGRTVASQRWSDVTFVHWRVDPAIVAPLLPPGIAPDVEGGTTWVGLIAFELSDARIGPIPRPGRWGSFTEVNVRLYGVDASGRRGVVFRSLEASSLPAVLAARALFSLPYVWARTDQRTREDRWEYVSQRISGLRYARPRTPGRRMRARGARFRLDVDVDRTAVVDTEVARFLTARWGLYQSRFGRTLWLPNTHEPWVLHPARVVTLHDELCAAAGLPGLSNRPPDSVLFSPGVTARFARGGAMPRP